MIPMKIVRSKIQISIKITPKFFSDPTDQIDKILSSYLFKYTYKLSGIPLCYKVVGIFPIGNMLCDNECIFVKTVVEIDLLRFKIGDIVEIKEGILFGIVYARCSDNECYSGRIRVVDVDNTNGENSVVIGEVC